ncbi:MAG: hypothetical protein ACYDAD_02555 [Acidimicrobiales bacterium]
MQALAEVLLEEGIEVQRAATRTTSAFADPDLIVVDSYLLRADDRSIFQAPFVVALDDLMRDLAVDVVVDPSPGAEADYPDCSRLRARRTLAGAPYSIVDPSLAGRTPRPQSEIASRVLVTMGAAGLGGGAGMAAQLKSMAPEMEVRLVVGPWSEEGVPQGVRAVAASDGLAAQLSWADVVVTAGGVTFLEALCLGRPTVAVAIADNQRRAVSGASRVGAAIAAEPGEAASVVASLVADPPRRRELAERAAALVDGRGARRAVEVVLALARGV